MNTENRVPAERGINDLGWLVRCKTGCEGIVHNSVPSIGDPCPLCASEHVEKPCITYCVKIAVAGDTYEQMSMEGGISFDGDVVRAWDVDLGSFLTSVDPQDGDVTQADGKEESRGSPALGAESGASQKVTDPEKQGIQTCHVGDSQNDVVSAGTTVAHLPEHERESDGVPELHSRADGMRFSKWHVLGLICCAVLLLIGGLLTFDIVRALYSPNDMTIASPILRVLR